MDWNSNAVAYGYQYCGFACQSLYKGFWLTFSDNQGAFPSDPQGQSDAFNPTFYKTRVVFRGLRRQHLRAARRPRGAVHELLPGLAHARRRLSSSAAPRSRPPTTRSRSTGSGTTARTGITVAQHSGTVPSDLVAACDLPAAGKASYATFSPDGSQMAWTDDEGLKVAGVPNLAAGTDTCTLTAPAHVISATGRVPSFGGADVNAVAGVGGAAGGAGGGRRSAPSRAPTPKAIRVRLSGKATRAAFAKGLTLKVGALKAGRIDASAAIAKKAARKLRLSGGASAARIATRGFAAASTVTVARGHAKARRAGTVKLRLKPTKAAKRAAKRMRKVVLTIKVSQPGAAGKATVSSSCAGVLAASSLASTRRSAGDVLVREDAAEALLEGGGEHRAHVGERRRPLAGQLGPHDAPVMRRDPAAATQPRFSRPVDQPRRAAAADQQRVGELEHRQPPPGGDHQPVDRLVLQQRRAGGLLEPPVQRAAQQRVGAVQLGPRREALEIPPVWADRSTPVDDGIVDGGKTAARSGSGRELERAQALGDLRAAAVQPAHDGAGRHAQRLAALGVGEAEHVDGDERLAVRAGQLVDGVEHRAAVQRRVAARASWRAAARRAVVERQRLRTPRTGAQLVAPAVAQGAEQVAQLVAAAEPAGAGEDGGVGVLDQVFGEVGIAAESTGGGVEPVEVSDRRFGVEASGHVGGAVRGGGREPHSPRPAAPP